MPEMRTYKGGCHCGTVAFEVDAAIEQAISCNCSICRKRGLLLAFAQPDDFRLQSGEEALTDYGFNTQNIRHVFCKVCGVESFARGKVPRTGAQMIALNLRCLEGIDLDSLPVRPFDGASL